jgi:hypothetical protein
MMKQTYLSAALTLCAGMAQAGEYYLLDGTEMFSCTFNGGAKAVELCDAIWEDDDMASYGFSKFNRNVEKEIRTLLKNATKNLCFEFRTSLIRSGRGINVIGTGGPSIRANGSRILSRSGRGSVCWRCGRSR